MEYNNKAFALIYHTLFPSDVQDKDEKVKVLLMYIFTCIAILFLLINAKISFAIGSLLCAYVDMVAAASFSILILWPSKKNLSPFICIGLLIALALIFFLFIHGGTDRHGFLWSYTVPLFTFFLLGCRKGLIVNICYLLCCIFIISIDTQPYFTDSYNALFAFRFSFSFLVVLIFSYCYEFFRYKSEHAYKQIASNLETLVQERTQELEQEILKKEQLYQKLRKSEKLEAVGRIAGNVAHDLNNILTGVVGYPELLLQTTSSNDPLYKPLQSIRESGKRAAAVASDLLTIARGVIVEKEPLELDNILEQHFKSLEYKDLVKQFPALTINIDLGQPQVNILCNPVHIQKLIMNLVNNAAEAVETNGYVKIATERRSTPNSENTTNNETEITVLTVSDNGSGIEEKDINNIFEPFFSNKVVGRSGTGLGLAIVKNIVDDHGASINVSSSKSGTIFEITFQTSKQPLQMTLADIDIAELKGSGKILVVDDDKNQRMYTKKILEFLGYSVSVVSNGQEAITFCKSDFADLYLLDLHMNASINGLQTYQEIIKRQPHQKVILTSGYLTHEVELESKQLGINAVLKKPYSLKDLAQSLKTTISKQPIE